MSGVCVKLSLYVLVIANAGLCTAGEISFSEGLDLLKQSIEIKRATHVLRQSEYSVEKFKGDYLPQVQISRQVNDVDQSLVPEIGVARESKYRSKADVLTLRQSLFNKSKYEQISYSQALYEAELHNLEDLLLGVTEKYALAVADYCQSDLTARFNSHEVKYYDFDIALLARAVDRKEATRIELLNSEAQKLEASTAIERNSNKVLFSLQRVNDLVGATDNTKILGCSLMTKLESKLVEKEGEIKSMDLNFRNTPRGQSQSAQINAAEISVKVASGGHFPIIDLTAQYSESVSDDVYNPRYKSTVTALGFNITVPIFQGGTISANQRIAVERSSEAVAAFELAQQETKVKFLEAKRGFFSTALALRAKRASVELNKIKVEAANRAKALALGSERDVKSAELELLRSQAALDELNIEWFRHYVRLLRVSESGDRSMRAKIHSLFD